MPFKISAQRKRWVPPSVASKGLVLRPNAGIEASYQAGLLRFNQELLGFVYQELRSNVAHYHYGRTFDHPFQAFLKDVFRGVKVAMDAYLEAQGAPLISHFVDQSQAYTDSSVSLSLKTLGLMQPRMEYNRAIQTITGLTHDANCTLITSISDETQAFLYERIMQSLTSDKPEEQGQQGIVNALQEAGIKNRSRIHFIAKDQTSKLYSALSNARLDQNGVDAFEWLHSGAGKQPRPLHLSYNGKVYRRDDPRFDQAPPADRGLPGFAFNCRCTMLPVIHV